VKRNFEGYLKGTERCLLRGVEPTNKTQRKIHGFYFAYILTMAICIVFISCFIIIGNFKYIKAYDFSIDWLVTKIVSHIVSNEFTDLSFKDNAQDIPKNEPAQDAISGDTSNGKEDLNDDKNDSKPDGLYFYDYTAVPNGKFPIVPMDLSLISYGSGYIFNSTLYKPDIDELLQMNWIDENYIQEISSNNLPQVLIVHTHTSESYFEEGVLWYEDGDGELARSQDPEENVIAVGNAVSQVLNRNGIPTLHCTVVHDTQYKDSYYRAKATIEYYLEKFPSIQLVIDIHRDAVIKSNGEMVRPVCDVDDKAAAQLMFVVGSDYGGEACPSWKSNLALALQLREMLNDSYGNVCRPVSLRASTYNQELAQNSLLIEVGSCGNSIDEALRSAKIFAEALSKMLSKK